MNDYIKCPVCGAVIMYHRHDDGDFVVAMQSDGKGVVEHENESHGYTETYCCRNKEHRIPQELHDEIIEIAEGFGY